MDSVIHLNSFAAERSPSAAEGEARLAPTPAANPQAAQITNAQRLLFAKSPVAVCQELGLNWWTAQKLHEEGWLSFAPEKTAGLDESQEAELRFVGALVVGGCDRNLLEVLLKDLPRPYAYDLKRLFFDWETRRWKMLPEPETDREAAFSEWVELLVQRRDARTLSGIAELARDALSRLYRL
ncbi:MAG TPA: hypothetical protein P5038_02830 [Candidatus Paceibacterota bacterium]|nr:hypothetical protein [Candidatus Paceibacterota bacterium]HRT55541.1 hypothetical protein [Candidatus Paceibacterota bacterium]